MKIVNIIVKMDDFIVNPCSSFLSYLYKSNGWKRAIFGTSKENYIKSQQDDSEIRILISETRNVLISAQNRLDIITALDFIESEFKNSRMHSYLNKNADMKLDIKAELYLDNWGDFEFNENEIKSDKGTIKLKGNKVLLEFSTWEDGEKLKNLVIDTFSENVENIETEMEDVVWLTSNRMIYASCFSWITLKLLSYF